MIDSYIWDHVSKLTDEYNGRYSSRRKRPNGSEVYDYGSGIRVSSHIVSMLFIAASKMMDRAEAVIFLNTDENRKIYENKTLSRRYLPWVYTEMVIAGNMRRKQLNTYKRQASEMHNAALANIEVTDMYNVTSTGKEKTDIYSITSTGIETISEKELDMWEKTYGYGEDRPLDTLYKLLNII
jgi:hypothetical protein